MQASCRIKYRKRFRTSIPYKLFHLGKKEPRCSFFRFWVYKEINEKGLQIKRFAALCTQTRDRTGMDCSTGV